MLAEYEFLQLLVLLREEDKILQEAQHLRHGAEALHLSFQLAHLLVFPVKEISPDSVPRHAVGEADGLGRRKNHLRHHHLGRLVVVSADLVHAEGDGLVLARVLALDYQHGNPVD